MENRKQDMARAIARNMAASDSFDDTPTQGVGVTDFGEDAYYDAPRRRSDGTRTAKKRPQGSSSARSGSSGKKKSGSSSGKKKSSRSQSSKPAAKSSAPVKKKKKKKNKLTATKIMLNFTIIVVGLALMISALYFAGLKTYEDSFLDNTIISGVNVGGMTKKEAIAELKKQSVIPEAIYITKKDGSGINIKLSDIGYVDNTTVMIERFFNGQDHGKWFQAKFTEDEYTLKDAFSYDKKKLENVLSHKLAMNQNAAPPRDAYIVQNDSGFFSVIPEADGDSIDDTKLPRLYTYVENELDNLNFDIAIGSVDCYRTAKLKSADLSAECNRLNNMYNLQITFEFALGKETVSGSQVMEWVNFDENAPVNALEVDRDAVERYVQELSIKYDTFGKDRLFKSTNRGTITVKQGKGCYGWWLDIDKMTDLIVNAIENGESVKSAPIYYENPALEFSYTCDPDWYKPEGDFGKTYIEVDLKEQHMWYYENGKLKLESDVISGYSTESRNTPEGVYKLWAKERDKTLSGINVGYNYSERAEYWCNFSTINIGFHAASWKESDFGGEKYKSSEYGTYGSISLPTDAAKYIYENVPLGTPVFAYW